MGKAKSSRKNVKKATPASGMIAKSNGPANTFGKPAGGMNQNFASTKKKGGFSVTPRKAS